jgi:urease accessory protein
VSLTARTGGTAALVLRSLSNSTGELDRLLQACTGLLRQSWYGQAPMNLRKY